MNVMAGIDKTYIKGYEQYREIADWARAQGTVTDSFGNRITPYSYIPHRWEYDEGGSSVDLGEWTEEYVNEWLAEVKERCPAEVPEIPLWNTDHVFDFWLIRNCPIEWIQGRLKEQYGAGWSKEAFSEHPSLYQEIKDGTSAYDLYQRQGVRRPHFKVLPEWWSRFKDSRLTWWITVFGPGRRSFDYDPAADYWYPREECHYPVGSVITTVCKDRTGNMTRRRLKRLLGRWELPVGTTVRFSGEYGRRIMKKFSVVIKE